jgi:hypothetical protein
LDREADALVQLAANAHDLDVHPVRGRPGANPPPSVLDLTRGGGFGLALGLGVQYEGAYDGSDEYEFELDPRGAVHWLTGNHFFFDEGIELGWRARVDDDWLVQLNAGYQGG